MRIAGRHFLKKKVKNLDSDMYLISLKDGVLMTTLDEFYDKYLDTPTQKRVGKKDG